MITSLRKRHRYHWIIISILLAVGFTMAFLNMSTRVSDAYTAEKLPEAYPEILKTADNAFVKLNLRADGQNNLQLEILLKKPVKLPTPVLYAWLSGEGAPEGNTAIAPLGASGLYRFPLENSDIKGVFFYSSLNGKSAYLTEFKQ